MTTLSVEVLGTFAVRINGEVHRPQSKYVARFGALLAGWPGEVVSREALIQELWRGKAPRTAVNTLQAYASQLRALLGKDVVQAFNDGYLLDIGPDQVDADIFEELLAEAARAQRHLHLGHFRDLLERALGLWHETPFKDLENPELVARADLLIEKHANAQEDMVENHLELATDIHDFNDVIARSHQLVALHPWRERRREILIRALAAADRVAEARREYSNTLKHFGTIAGWQPGRDLLRIIERIESDSPLTVPIALRPLSAHQLPLRPPHRPPSLQPAARQLFFQRLVEQNVPSLVIECHRDLHLPIASCLATEMQENFPLGIYSHADLDSDLPVNEHNHGSLVVYLDAATHPATPADLEPLFANGHRVVVLTHNPTTLPTSPRIVITNDLVDPHYLADSA